MKKMLNKTIFKTVAVLLVIGGLIYALYRYFIKGNTTNPLTGNSVFSFGSDDWKDGDYVQVIFWKNEYIEQLFNPEDFRKYNAVVSPPAPVSLSAIQGVIKLPTTEQANASEGTILGYVTILGPTGGNDGQTFIIRKSIVKSIRKINRPVGG
jgi:hypothetical protein